MRRGGRNFKRINCLSWMLHNLMREMAVKTRLTESFVFDFHYYGNNISSHPSSSSNIVSSFNPCCYFFFIHAFRYKQIEIFDIVFVFVWFYFCTTQIFNFLTTNDNNYLNSLYIFHVYLFFRRLMKYSGRRVAYVFTIDTLHLFFLKRTTWNLMII